MNIQEVLKKIGPLDVPEKQELQEQLQGLVEKKITAEQQVMLQELSDAIDGGKTKHIREITKKIRDALLQTSKRNDINTKNNFQEISEILKNPNFYTPENIQILERDFRLGSIEKIKGLDQKLYNISINGLIYKCHQRNVCRVIANQFFEGSTKPVRMYLSKRKQKIKHDKAIEEAKQATEENEKSDPAIFFKNPEIYTPKNIKILEKAFGIDNINELRTHDPKLYKIGISGNSFEYSQIKLADLISNVFFKKTRNATRVRAYLSLRKQNAGHQQAIEDANKATEKEENGDPSRFFKNPNIYTPKNIRILEKAFELNDICEIRSNDYVERKICIGGKTLIYKQGLLVILLGNTFFQGSKKHAGEYLSLRKKGIEHLKARNKANRTTEQKNESDPTNFFKDPKIYTPSNIEILERAFGLNDISDISEANQKKYTIKFDKNYKYSQRNLVRLLTTAFFHRTSRPVRIYLSLRKQGIGHNNAVEIAQEKAEADAAKFFQNPDIYTPENILILEKSFELDDIANFKGYDVKLHTININEQTYEYTQKALTALLIRMFLKNGTTQSVVLYLSFRKQNIDHNTAIDMALQGKDTQIDLEDEKLAELGVEELIALFQDSPKKLAFCLKRLHPHLTEEEIERLTIRGFRNLSTRANITKEEQYLRWPEELPDIVIHTAIPKRTAENVLMIEGTAKGAEYVYMAGCRHYRVRVSPDGSFTMRAPLKTGETNSIRLMSLCRVESLETEDEEDDTQHWIRSTQEEFEVRQTGTPDDIEELVRYLNGMGDELMKEIQTEPHKTLFYVDQFEHFLIKKFSQSFEEGKKYVNSLLRKHRSKFMQNILNTVLVNFQEINEMTFPGVHPERQPYFFQKFCIRLILKKIREVEIQNSAKKGAEAQEQQGVAGFIIANAPGTGKTSIVLIALNGEKMCIVAPNAVVSGWEEEAHECLTDPDLIVLREMTVSKRKDLLEKNAESHRVMNREFLRDLGDAERFSLASGPDFVVVTDEGHSLTHDSLQTQGTLKLPRKFLLVVTASPAKDPETLCRLLAHFYPGDKRFSSTKAFSEAFPSDDPKELRKLRLLLEKHMVRFTEDDVMELMDPTLPAEEQKHRLPAKEYVDPYKGLGSFTMHPKQAHAIYELFLNYPKWYATYGHNFPKKKDIIAKLDNLYTGDQMTKKHAMRQIINNPSFVGVTDCDPKAEKVREIIAECDQEGRPPVVFCAYNSQTDKYASMLADRDPAMYTGLETLRSKKFKRGPDGNPLHFKHAERKAQGKRNWEFDTKTGELNVATAEDKNSEPMHILDYHRLRFQNAKSCQALVATYKAGSEGTTFTRGKAIIRDDLEEDYLMRYQTDGRIRRIDHKYPTHTSVKYYSLISTYPEEFLEEMKQRWVVKQEDGTYKEFLDKDEADEEAVKLDTKAQTAFKAFFEQGTWDQVHHENLQTQQEIFQIINDGIGDSSLLKIDQSKFKGFNSGTGNTV